MLFHHAGAVGDGKRGRENSGSMVGEPDRDLESLLQSPVQHFCYPYGDYTNDHVVQSRQAGFVTATTTVRGRCQIGTDLMQLPRVPVLKATSLPVLWLKLTTGYEERRTS